MAAPINVFKSVTKVLTTTAIDLDEENTRVYTAPGNNTAIVLMAQIANTGSGTANATFSLVKVDPLTSNTVETPLVSDFPIPQNDALDVLSGKLIVEEGQQLHAKIDSGANAAVITVSVLESRNA